MRGTRAAVIRRGETETRTRAMIESQLLDTQGRPKRFLSPIFFHASTLLSVPDANLSLSVSYERSRPDRHCAMSDCESSIRLR